MPMERERYPDGWEQMALDVKQRAGWRCDCRGLCSPKCSCAKQCLRPGEKGSQRNRLTVAHVDHDPENPTARLRAMCAPCHLRYDGSTRNAEKRARRLAIELYGDSARVELQGHPTVYKARATSAQGNTPWVYWHDTHRDAWLALCDRLDQALALVERLDAAEELDPSDFPPPNEACGSNQGKESEAGNDE